jgi:hypothetical protein
MFKKTVALSSAFIAMSAGGSVHAEGFVDDAKASLALRNFYFNGDNRSHDTNPRQEEWGQGFLLNLQSGFTQGTVGFGVDAVGMLGLRLDGGGKAGTNTSSRNPSANSGAGNLFPADSDNSAVSEYSSLGLTGKARLSKTEARLGVLMPKLPVIVYNDGRLLPQTFKGAQVTSKEVDNLTLIAGQLESGKGRASTSYESLSMSGAQNGADTNKFYYAGADYAFSKHLVGQYYYGQLSDFYKQHFLGLQYSHALAAGSLKADLRYWYSDSDGKNGSASGRSEGYLASGYYGRSASGAAITRGEVENQTWSAALTYSLGGHSLLGGYQQVIGDSNFPFINQGDTYRGEGGSTTALITDKQISNFARAGENTWLAQYAYDFAAVGVPGLSTSVTYLHGSSINSATGGLNEFERDIAISYVVQVGTFKNLGFAIKNAALRSEASTDIDQNRVIVSYTLPLL